MPDPIIELEDALVAYRRMTEAASIERSRQFILSHFRRYTLTAGEAEQLEKAPGLASGLYAKLRRIAGRDE
jgi:hypothetical protein